MHQAPLSGLGPVVFMGTPAFAVPALEALAQAGAPLVGVVCQPDRPAGRGQKLAPPPVKQSALALGLEVVQPERIKRNEDFLGWLRAKAPSLIVVVAYGRILPPEVLDLPTHGCVNVHASLLPKHRGAAPIQWAIAKGDATTGVALMRMDVGLDTGPHFAMAEEAIALEDTTATLSPRLSALGAKLLVQHLPAWVAGQLPAQEQDHGQATLAPLLKKEDGRLDWRRSARALDAHLRGMTPWPGGQGRILGEDLKLVQAQALPDAPSGAEAGTLVALGPEGWDVACGEGVLRLKLVQRAGKPVQAAAAIAQGWRDLAVGLRFEAAHD